MDYHALAERLFPDNTLTPDTLEERFPHRTLPQGAMVTRFAPSPTGFMHLGNLYGAMIDERLAHQSGGVFYLRIEDTDQKRTVEGGIEAIVSLLMEYQMPLDECAASGAYGPYRQRQRAEIYQACAKWLVRQGRAYPCFCTEQELTDTRTRQTERKDNPGYYGEWAVCRTLSADEIDARLQAGQPWVLRFRSPGDPERRVTFQDLARGELSFPENEQDVVLLKTDGIPTYHFAHVVDDHFMRTTHVVRGDEWLATLPFHVQLFDAMGWTPPQYIHTTSLMKLDGDSKRKLSKRKDPEAAMSFYAEQGYPIIALKEYIMTLLNSNYEEWRSQNPERPLEDFPFTVERMSAAGALFDMDKLDDIAKNYLSRLTAGEIVCQVKDWTARHDPDFHVKLQDDMAYAEAIFAIGRGGDKPRKDLVRYRDAREYAAFFYDDWFTPPDWDSERPACVPADKAAEILAAYAECYDPAEASDAWFARVKALAERFGYAPEVKLFKKNPGQWPGHVGDISMLLRLAVTGRKNSPDLCACMQILGAERCRARLHA